MGSRKYAGKDTRPTNEFIHIDLLPDVKRPRNLNINLLLIVLIAVVASWLIIYLPLTSRQTALDAALERSGDAQYELLLVNEQLVGLNIENERIAFYERLERAQALQTDFDALHDAVAAEIERRGVIHYFLYDAVAGELYIQVSATSITSFDIIDFDLIELPMVIRSQYTVTHHEGTRVHAEFVVEVDLDVE